MKTTDDCQIDDGFVNYLVFTFCNFNSDQIWVSLLLLVRSYINFFLGWFVYLKKLFFSSSFGCLFFLLDWALLPTPFFVRLRVIADKMRLSQNIAGVTFLAFGNGAPDVFSAIAAITNAKNGDAGLAFGALLGAGIFVSTVVAGTICIIKPFTSNERPLLRDLIFFMVASFWTFTVIWDGYIALWETVGK